VIVAGYKYVHPDYWTQVPQEARRQPTEFCIADAAKEYVKEHEKLEGTARNERIEQMKKFTMAEHKLGRMPIVRAAYQKGGVAQPEVMQELDKLETRYKTEVPTSAADKAATAKVLQAAEAAAPDYVKGKWGLLGLLGVNKYLASSDHQSNFFPYGLSGMMV